MFNNLFITIKERKVINMNYPKISVIVPIYNVEKYLRNCIDSILAQTYKNLEVILVDDESPDKSPIICDEYRRMDNRVRVIHKKNEGLGYARNTGLDIATGEYVVFVDSDDYIEKNMIKTLYDKLNETNSDTVFCGLKRVYPDGTVTNIPAYYNNMTFKDKEIIDKVLLEMVGSKPEAADDTILYMSVWHAIYSNELIKKNKIRFPSEREFMSEDISFHIDYLRNSRVVTYVSDCLYYYRVNNLSLSKSYDANRFERQKKLYSQILTKLSVFLSEDEYLEREQRRFLGGVRGRIIDIVQNEKENKIEKIKYVNNDELVERVLKTYPYGKNPLRHRLFNYLIKHKANISLFFVTKCLLMLRGDKYD